MVKIKHGYAVNVREIYRIMWWNMCKPKMLRKGQVLCNYIQKPGVANKDVHQILFYMSDKEFDKAFKYRDSCSSNEKEVGK